MDEKIFQEFYCGECSGYIRLKLNMDYDRCILLVCPSCKHEHERFIKGGQIFEYGRNGAPVEHLCPTKSAYSKEAMTIKMKNTRFARDGVVIKSEKDLIKDSILRERWLEIYGEGYES